MRFLSQLRPKIPLQEAGGRPHAVQQQIKRAISYWGERGRRGLEGGRVGEQRFNEGVGHVVFVFPRVGQFI